MMGGGEVIIKYGADKNYTLTKRMIEGTKISTNESIPIFPLELFNALSFTLSFPKSNFIKMINHMKCKVLIFSLGDFEEIDIDIADMIVDLYNRNLKMS